MNEKICKDCRHWSLPLELTDCGWQTVSPDIAKCSLIATDVVTGDVGFPLCRDERSRGACSPEGKNWEAK